MAKPKAHQLYKQLGAGALTVTTASAGTGSVSGQWEIVQIDSDTAIIANRTYIDLAGWSAQDLTTFTQSIDIQKMQIPLKVPSPGSTQLWEYDFITTRKITDAELINIGGLPGFSSSTVDLMEVIYGERMFYAENTAIPGTYVQISADTFGSGNPTAMDKLHWTRLIVAGSPVDGDQLAIWPTNLIVQAMTVEEKDLVWMERLRRSYELQGGAD